MKKLQLFILVSMIHLGIQAQTGNVFWHQTDILNQIFKNENSEWNTIDAVKNGQSNQEVYLLTINGVKEFNYFLTNIDDFKTLKVLRINKIAVQDFRFLKILDDLILLQIDLQKNTHISSLIRNMNKMPALLHLEIKNSRLRSFPDEFNELIYLKSLKISNTKMRELNVDLKLHSLEIHKNNKLISLKAPGSEYILLYQNNVSSFPDNLGKSAVLKGLSISQFSTFEYSCPIHGFRNLEILDLFETPSVKINPGCFVENSADVEVFCHGGCD